MEIKSNKETEQFMNEALEEAKKSTCSRKKCGSVIVKNNEVIGRGFNSPPNNLESQRRCKLNKEDYHKKVTDKTCCVHAEQRAIIDALAKNSEKIKDSILYFIRLDEEGKKAFSKEPYCTICSKMALDVGIKYFVLWHKEGICFYDTEEYNKASYEYKNKVI